MAANDSRMSAPWSDCRAQFVILAAFAVILVLLTGCASFDAPRFEPTEKTVTITVKWVEPGYLCACTPSGGCSQRLPDGSYMLWLVKPQSWADTAGMANMGHELAHALGAVHVAPHN